MCREASEFRRSENSSSLFLGDGGCAHYYHRRSGHWSRRGLTEHHAGIGVSLMLPLLRRGRFYLRRNAGSRDIPRYARRQRRWQNQHEQLCKCGFPTSDAQDQPFHEIRRKHLAIICSDIRHALPSLSFISELLRLALGHGRQIIHVLPAFTAKALLFITRHGSPLGVTRLRDDERWRDFFHTDRQNHGSRMSTFTS
jgi:hypothetical protein